VPVKGGALLAVNAAEGKGDRLARRQALCAHA